MRRILVLALLLAGCKRCSTSAMTPADAGRPATTMWVSTPDTTGELASIIEGPCLRLRSSALGKEVYLHDFGVVARWSGTAPVDAGKLSRNLEGTTRVGFFARPSTSRHPRRSPSPRPIR